MNKDIVKRLGRFTYYDLEALKADCKLYCKLLERNAVLFRVVSVSRSGMSRKIEIIAYNKTYYRSFYTMLDVLGFNLDKSGNIIVRGCGMNMVFHLNLQLLKKIEGLGFIRKKRADILAQRIN